MKTPFDFVKDILTRPEFQDISPCDSFVPFLVQKGISGASPEYCNLINSVLNTKLQDWRDNQQILDLLTILIPKKKGAGYKYYGKAAAKKEQKVDVASISDALEISQRELKEMLEYFPELEDSMVEDKEKILKLKK